MESHALFEPTERLPSWHRDLIGARGRTWRDGGREKTKSESVTRKKPRTTGNTQHAQQCGTAQQPPVYGTVHGTEYGTVQAWRQTILTALGASAVLEQLGGGNA